MGAKPEADGPRQGGLPFTLRDSAVFLTALTAVLYLCGSLHLGAYYGTLGLSEGEVQREVPAVLEASLLPLLPLLVYLFFLTVFAMMLPSEAPRGRFAPFHPMPTTKVVAIVVTLWAFKVVADSIEPPAPVYWWQYQRRSVLFFVFTTGVVAFEYFRHWHAGRERRHRLSGVVYWASGMLGLAVLLGIFSVVSGSGGPYSWWQHLLFAVAAAGIVILVVRERGEDGAEPENREAPGHRLQRRLSRSTTMFAVFVAVLMLLVGSGVSGSVAAREAMVGCTARDSIAFEPLPEVLDENATYWLVVHHDGVYYLRHVDPEAGDEVLVVHEGPSLSARIGSMAATTVC